MHLILDACTVLNLLQIDLEEDRESNVGFNYDFFTNIDKLSCSKIVIVKKVYDEITINYAKNLSSATLISYLDTYIRKNLYKYIPFHQPDVDYESSKRFVQTVNNYSKDNGELHSTVYALYANRYNDSHFMKTLFITDDDGAIKDFHDFFHTNMLGQIIVSIDLLTILFSKNLLDKNTLLKFASDLRKHYIQDYNLLLIEIDLIKKTCSTQESALLTKLIELMDTMQFTSLENSIMLHSTYQDLVRKHKRFKTLLENLITQDYEKVEIIDRKINLIKEKLWDISVA